MIAHPYGLRSRISSSSLNTNTPVQSPIPKSAKTARKGSSFTSTLQLRNVIGTTTASPAGLSCCVASKSYAYCAGSVAVLASLDSNDVVSFRYFKARPTVTPVNQITTYYDSPSTVNTPTRRKTGLNARNVDEYGSASPGYSWLEDPSGQTWSARERIKAASCVSISPDGKILAVGETGYNPRVLLFSTALTAALDTPLSIMTEHTIGVRCVAFSPDSKYLATLGDVNDGFLYVWQINTRTGSVKLQSSNKCTTNVCDMAWCGNSVITVGTRHIKVWQALSTTSVQSKRRSRIRAEGESPAPGPIPLQGRNCLLGSYGDATFTAVTAISDNRAIVCADEGSICLLDLSHDRIELSLYEKTEATVAAIAYGQKPNQLIWSSNKGLEERDLGLQDLSLSAKPGDPNHADTKKRRKVARQSLLRQSLGLSPPKRANTVALGCIEDKVICIAIDGTLRIFRLDSDDLEGDIHKLASHDGFVRGVQHVSREANLGSFFTWGKNGEVRFWTNGGECLRAEIVNLDGSADTEDAVVNELKTMRYLPGNKAFVTGDQFGAIKVIDQDTWSCACTIRAHSAEITDIDVYGVDALVATCGRDRMVQIFQMNGQEQLDLLQTSDDHISAVTEVLFSQNGNRLLSCSADRTVVIRDRVKRQVREETATAFIPTRTITLKAAPLSMNLMPTNSQCLVVSTMDRQVIQVDTVTGNVLASFKVSDRDSEDTVSLNKIIVRENGGFDRGCLLSGYSAIDKSIRLYDLEKGLLLGRDSGHIEGVSDVSMFWDEAIEGQPEQLTVVSTGLDGTIMIWSAAATGQPQLTPQQELSQSQAMNTDPEKMMNSASSITAPPMRKILTKTDIADFVRQNSPTREASPNGLRRKTSRLALTTSIEEAEESPSPDASTSQPQERRGDTIKRSPSPPGQIALSSQRLRLRPGSNKATDGKSSSLSQSPPTSAIASPSPIVPKPNTRANNSRLRRPPSVPNDLRAYAAAQGRKQSVNIVTDSGSIAMATEQTCRMLRAYKKKLQACREHVDLDDVEADLDAALQTVRQKKAKMANGVGTQQTKGIQRSMNDEVNELGALLEKTSVS